MQTAWNRANAAFFFGLSVLAVMATIVNLTTYARPEPPNPVVNELKVNQLVRFGSHMKQDKAVMSFDLDYDLTSVFDWSVKGIYVSIYASYETKNHAFNQVVVYDKIVLYKDRDEAKGTLEGVLSSYRLEDAKTDLRGADLKFTLMWDVMPVSGLVYRSEKESEQVFSMPNSYIRK